MNIKFFAAASALLLTVMVIGCASGGAGGASGPKGKNLAEGKTVAASSFEKSGMEPEKAVDGYVQTRWGSDFKDGDTPWWSVDLGAKSKISIITINFEAAFGKAFDIQVSDDNQNWKTVLSVTDGHAGENILTLPSPVETRYVKYLGVKRGLPYGHSFWEFGVYEN